MGTKKQIIEQEAKKQSCAYLLRALSLAEFSNTSILVVTSYKNKGILESNGFKFVTTPREIKEASGSKKLATIPCRCGNLHSAVIECNCDDKLAHIYGDRIKKLALQYDYVLHEDIVFTQADFDVIVSRHKEAITPKSLFDFTKDMEVANDVPNLLEQAIARFPLLSKTKILEMAQNIAQFMGDKVIQKTHCFEAIGYSRGRY